MAGLRVVGGADDGAVVVVGEDEGVLPLDAGGHGLADPGKGLVAIEAV